MKKICIFALIVAFAFSFSACDRRVTDEDTKAMPESEAAPVVEATSVADDTNTGLKPPDEQDEIQQTYSLTDVIPTLSDWTYVGVIASGGSMTKFDEGKGLGGRVFAPASDDQAQRIVDVLMTLGTAEFADVQDMRRSGTISVDGDNIVATMAWTMRIDGTSGICVLDICTDPELEGVYYLSPSPLNELKEFIALENPTDEDIPIQHVYMVQSDSFSLIDLVRVQTEVFRDTTDMRNIAVVYKLNGEGQEHLVQKTFTAQMRQILDGTIRVDGVYEDVGEQDYDLKIVIGDSIYMLDTANGWFTREQDGETVLSKLDDEWLQRLLAPISFLLD